MGQQSQPQTIFQQSRSQSRFQPQPMFQQPEHSQLRSNFNSPNQGNLPDHFKAADHSWQRSTPMKGHSTIRSTPMKGHSTFRSTPMKGHSDMRTTFMKMH